MIVNVESSKVFVFPCVSRSTDNEQDNLNAKLMSEKNITNIIKTITDNKSYIISWDSNLLKCVIDGYYFEINGIEITDNKYAYITMQDGTSLELIKADDGQTFAGITITDDIPNVAHYLTLCDNGKIPIDSLVKFRPESFGFDRVIDCGLLQDRKIY